MFLKRWVRKIGDTKRELNKTSLLNKILPQNGKPLSIFLPLRVKFIILFFLLITIPFLVSGTITYFKYSSSVEESTEEHTQQIVDQINLNLDRYIKEIERLTLAPLYDKAVLDILREHSGSHQDDTYLSAQQIMKMNLFISSLSYDRLEIESILIFANDGSLFSNLHNTVSPSWQKGANPWMEQVIDAEGGLFIIPPHIGSYYLDQKRQVVSIARTIRQPYTNENLGIVKVDLTAKGFEKIISTVNFSKNSMFYIVNEEQDVLYSITDERLPIAQEHMILMNDEPYLSATAKSDYTGLKVVGLIPLKDLRRDAQELTRFTLIISILSLVCAYFISILSSNRLVKPIRRLQRSMVKVKKGSFKERVKVTTHDEIGQLTEDFNSMVSEIDRLVREVYEIKLREREAELSTLQSQINPHFLYNTLESINMLAIKYNHLELSDVVTSLGKLFRYTVDKQEKPVYLYDEILFIESYMKIQAFRLRDKIKTAIHIDPSLDHALVPKLILQPLVENVIEHGLTNSIVHIKVSARVEKDHLILTVRDNGAGMSSETIKKVEQRIYSSQDSLNKYGFGQVKKGVALRNVHQRIRLLYGEPYGLYLDKEVETGTLFNLVLPFQWEE